MLELTLLFRWLLSSALFQLASLLEIKTAQKIGKRVEKIEKKKNFSLQLKPNLKCKRTNGAIETNSRAMEGHQKIESRKSAVRRPHESTHIKSRKSFFFQGAKFHFANRKMEMM